MDKAERKLAFEVQFWALIAPLIPLVTLFVILIKAPTQAIYLSAATIFGFLACWKWKTKGVLTSLFLILACYLYQYSEITPDEHLWHVGINLAILLGFFIAASCFEEVEKLLDQKIIGIKHHFQQVVEKEEEDGEEKENGRLKALENELLASKTQINSYEKLVDSIKNEISTLNDQHQKLLEEFLQKQHLLSKTEEELFSTKNQVKALNQKVLSLEKNEDAESAGKLSQLQESLEVKVKEVSHLKSELEKLQKEKVQHQNNAVTFAETHNLSTHNFSLDIEAFDQLKNTNELLSRERGRLESLLFRSQVELHQKNQDLENALKQQSDLALLKEEKELLIQTIKEAEFRENDLQNRIYELAKEKDELTKKETNLELLEALKKQEQEKENLLLKEKILNQTIEEKNQELGQFLILKNAFEIKSKNEEKILLELKEIEALLNQEKLEKEKLLLSKNALSEEIAKKDQELTHFLELKNELEMISQKEEKARAELKELEALLTQEKLEKEKLEVLLKENILKKEKDESLLEEVISEESIQANLDKANPDLFFRLRKMEGKYNQLKEQFEEKSEVLNETRKELFKKEENLAALKLQLNEIEVYDVTQKEIQLENYLLQVIQQTEKEINHLKSEIEELYGVIAKLIHPEKNL